MDNPVSESEARELINGYQRFYAVHRTEFDKLMLEQFGKESVKLPEEDRRLFELALNYDDIIVGMLIGGELDPVVKVSINGPSYEYRQKIVLKLRSCVRFLRGVSMTPDQFAESLTDQLLECEAADPETLEIASLRYDLESDQLVFKMIGQDEKIVSGRLDVKLYIQRASQALFDNAGYLFGIGSDEEKRMAAKGRMLYEKCDGDSLKSMGAMSCAPRLSEAVRYELRQCLWAREFADSPVFPKSLSKREVPCSDFAELY